MIIKYKVNQEEDIKAIKQYKKNNDIMFIICVVYLLVVSIVGLIITYDEMKVISLMTIFLVGVIFVTRIIKTKKAFDNIRKRFNHMYGSEVEKTVTFYEDKAIWETNKNDNKFNLEYKIVKKVKIVNEYIIIYTEFKEWLYIKRNNLTIEEFQEILNIFKQNDIFIKGINKN